MKNILLSVLVNINIMIKVNLSTGGSISIKASDISEVHLLDDTKKLVYLGLADGTNHQIILDDTMSYYSFIQEIQKEDNKYYEK